MKSFKRLQARDILCGALLGDGSIDHQKHSTATCRMHIGHCDAQLEYLEFKARLLESCTPAKFRITHTVDNRNGTGYNHANSGRSKYFWKLRQLFYDSLKTGATRIMPKEFLEKYFNRFALMILILDDGNVEFNASGLFKELNIYTLSYTLEEVEFLRDLINERFNLEFRIRKRNYDGKDRYYLYVSAHDKTQAVIDVIKEGVPECMNYKLYFDCRPVNSRASLRHLNSNEHGEYIVRYISKKE